MKFKRINYLIDQSFGTFDGRTKLVTGFAVDFQEVRFCVRKRAKRDWVVDHYDTGLSIAILGVWQVETKREAALLAISRLTEKMMSGEYSKAVARVFNGDREAAA